MPYYLGDLKGDPNVENYPYSCVYVYMRPDEVLVEEELGMNPAYGEGLWTGPLVLVLLFGKSRYVGSSLN